MTSFYPVQEEHQLSIWLCTHRDFFVITCVRGGFFSYIFYLFSNWNCHKKYFLHSEKRIWDAVQKATTNWKFCRSQPTLSQLKRATSSHCSCVHCPIHKPLIKAEHSTLPTRLKGMQNLYQEIFSNLGVPHIISFFSFSFFHIFISA